MQIRRRNKNHRPRSIAQTVLRQSQSPTSSFRAKRGNPINRNENFWGDCQKPHLFSQSLTAQALFTLKIRRGKTQTTIPCECLLGEGVHCTQAVKRTLIRSLLINGMCKFADGTRAARRRAYERRTFVTHKPICFNRNKLQLFAFVLCVPRPTRQKLRFHHITRTQVRLFLTCGNPCACSTSDCAVRWPLPGAQSAVA